MYPFDELVTFKFSENVTRIDYDVNAKVTYKGIATKGSSSSDTSWKINRYTYSTFATSDKITLIESAIGSWDDRASLTYS